MLGRAAVWGIGTLNAVLHVLLLLLRLLLVRPRTRVHVHGAAGARGRVEAVLGH